MSELEKCPVCNKKRFVKIEITTRDGWSGAAIRKGDCFCGSPRINACLNCGVLFLSNYDLMKLGGEK